MPFKPLCFCTALKPHARRMFCMRKLRGFTMIELLVAMSIGAILAAIAVPNLAPMLERSRSWTNTNSMQGAINRARSEAARLGMPVTLCASANGTSCGGTWAGGWLLFGDANNNQSFDGGDVLVEKRSALGDGTTITAKAGSLAITAITVQPTGRISAGMTGGGQFDVVSGSTSRMVCLNVAGRTRVQLGGGSCT